MFKVPNKYRIRTGELASDDSFENEGAFLIKSLKLKQPLLAIASNGMGWEHVSVSLSNRCPTWGEMCFIKDLFWDEGDCVIQYHPPKSEYVNNHPFALHLWRPIGISIPMPPSILVGLKQSP